MVSGLVQCYVQHQCFLSPELCTYSATGVTVEPPSKLEQLPYLNGDTARSRSPERGGGLSGEAGGRDCGVGVLERRVVSGRPGGGPGDAAAERDTPKSPPPPPPPTSHIDFHFLLSTDSPDSGPPVTQTKPKHHLHCVCGVRHHESDQFTYHRTTICFFPQAKTIYERQQEKTMVADLA